RKNLTVDLFFGAALDEIAPFVFLGVDLYAQIEPADAVLSVAHMGSESLGPIECDFRDIQMHLAFVPVALGIFDHHHGPWRVKSGDRDLRVAWLAVGARMHDRNDAAGIDQVRAPREAAHDV